MSLAEGSIQNTSGEVTFRAGMRTTLVAEWAWAIGRIAVVGTVALGAFAQLRDSSAFNALITILVFTFAYDLVLIGALLKRQLAKTFVAGVFLDNVTLLTGWWIVARAQAGTDEVNDLYLILFPVLVVGVARLGSKVGPFYVGVWLFWVAWSTVVYDGTDSYEFEQLPIRLLFMATASGITIRIVGRLERERTKVRQALDELSAQHTEGRRRVQAFQSAADGLVLEQDQVQAFERLLEIVRTLLGVRFADLVIWNPEGEVDRVVRSGGEEAHGRAKPDELRTLAAFGGVGASFAAKDSPRDTLPRAIRVDDTTVLPMSCRDGSTGALVVGTAPGQELSVDDLQLLNLFALLTRGFIENTNLYARLIAEQQTLGAIQGSMVEGLLVVGPDRVIRYMNSAAARLVGHAESAMLGRSISDFAEACAAAVSDHATASLFETAVDHGHKLPSSFELHFVHPESRHVLVEAFGIPVSGEPMVGFLLRDVTEERELDERRNAFVSIASHELRTPMTSIVGFAELLLYREIPEEKRLDWVGRIYNESMRLSHILDDMLNVSRIHSNRVELRTEPTDVSATVEAVVHMMQPIAVNHRIIVEMPSDLPMVMADQDKLVQILFNFATNAVKYSPNGGDVTIHGTSDQEQGRVVLGVTDQGIGIAPEDMRKLFGTFQRIRNSETTGIRGTGLGLYIVKNLVDLMGGEVWVESKVGQGSTFNISLPQVDPRPLRARQAGA